jgi:plastocyanin
VNNTSQVHTVAPEGHARWQDAALGLGQQFEHTFNTAGVFNYYCTPHQVAGMTGVVRVQP